MTGFISAEREQLDLQRVRLEEILNQDLVSQDMKSDLRRLLDDIGQRLWELSAAAEAGMQQPMMQH